MLQKIKRIFAYCKYVWKTSDVDWDYSSLIQLLEMKISWMEQNFTGYHSRKRRKQLMICRNLLSRMNRNPYHGMYFTYHPEYIQYKDISRGRVINLEKVYQLKDNIPIDIRFGREPVSEQTDLNYLCKIMAKNMLYWWS